ncbi:hypothetical protein HPT30_06325 [Paenibacillus sp. JW14]|uniref:Uncharacterized protein n=1 Tax=Paenibacillus agri TaxID=2744309 RepID=A0A850EKR5_9BACL|nr:hypothetical protein [Paenibacillus agri]
MQNNNNSNGATMKAITYQGPNDIVVKSSGNILRK